MPLYEEASEDAVLEFDALGTDFDGASCHQNDLSFAAGDSIQKPIRDADPNIW